jgi:hypothetical protein
MNGGGNMKMRNNSHLLDYKAIYFQKNNEHSARSIVYHCSTTNKKKSKNFNTKVQQNNTNSQEKGWTNWTSSAKNVTHAGGKTNKYNISV